MKYVYISFIKYKGLALQQFVCSSLPLAQSTMTSQTWVWLTMPRWSEQMWIPIWKKRPSTKLTGQLLCEWTQIAVISCLRCLDLTLSKNHVYSDFSTFVWWQIINSLFICLLLNRLLLNYMAPTHAHAHTAQTLAHTVFQPIALYNMARFPSIIALQL